MCWLYVIEHYTPAWISWACNGVYSEFWDRTTCEDEECGLPYNDSYVLAWMRRDVLYPHGTDPMVVLTFEGQSGGFG